MSYYRAKNRSLNSTVFLQNRLTNFTNPPMRIGDLYVERDEVIDRDLLVRGNVTINNDLRANNFYATGNYYLDNYLLIPYGTIIQSAAVNIPDGWLNCNGSLLLRTEYTNLFNAIGYTYSTFSGTDLSFNIPDLQGRVPVGSGSGSGLTTRNLGVKGGAETHTLTVDEIPAHSHSYTNNVNDQTVSALPGEVAADQVDVSQTTGLTGGGQSHNNMQPFIVLRYLIKY
jgi:microcystin-dependent protein